MIISIAVYELTWKEANGPWQDTWADKGTTIQGVQEYMLEGLKCGTKYSLRMTASNSVGASQPAYVDAMTLGGGKYYFRALKNCAKSDLLTNKRAM